MNDIKRIIELVSILTESENSRHGFIAGERVRHLEQQRTGTVRGYEGGETAVEFDDDPGEIYYVDNLSLELSEAIANEPSDAEMMEATQKEFDWEREWNNPEPTYLEGRGFVKVWQKIKDAERELGSLEGAELDLILDNFPIDIPTARKIFAQIKKLESNGYTPEDYVDEIDSGNEVSFNENEPSDAEMFGAHELNDPIPGMEGPWKMRNGQTVYYDPRGDNGDGHSLGAYYDRKDDRYLTDLEAIQLFNPNTQQTTN